jgi:hypothetical protein
VLRVFVVALIFEEGGEVEPLLAEGVEFPRSYSTHPTRMIVPAP